MTKFGVFAMVAVVCLALVAGVAMADEALITAVDGTQYIVTTDTEGNVVSIVNVSTGETFTGAAAETALSEAGISITIGEGGVISGVRGGTYSTDAAAIAEARSGAVEATGGGFGGGFGGGGTGDMGGLGGTTASSGSIGGNDNPSTGRPGS